MTRNKSKPLLFNFLKCAMHVLYIVLYAAFAGGMGGPMNKTYKFTFPVSSTDIAKTLASQKHNLNK